MESNKCVACADVQTRGEESTRQVGHRAFALLASSAPPVVSALEQACFVYAKGVDELNRARTVSKHAEKNRRQRDRRGP